MLDPTAIRHFEGFGMSASTDGYAFQPTTIDEIRQVLAAARAAGRHIVLRGAGLSYGDAALLAEGVVLDLTHMNRFLSWDPKTGVADCQPGVTIEQLWRNGLPSGWWPPVVSGTMFPTLGGALGMNVHGKNNYRVGPIGEHVLELDVLLADGTLLTLDNGDPRILEFISSAGLLGIITRVKLQLKKVVSGRLKVYAESIFDWPGQIEAFLKREANADYMVSWVDAFGRDAHSGRGLFHAAWHETDADSESLLEMRQDLPSKILGVLPKSQVWRMLKPMNNRAGMRALNWVKHTSAKIVGNRKMHSQSLVEFSFLLDYVPNWKNAYLPGGLIQYQSFLPTLQAERVFRTQMEWSQQIKQEPFLAVMKRHRPDSFLLSHGVDGFSLALDYKVTESSRADLWKLAHRMNDLVLEAGGRFYLAKDSTLRPFDLRYLGGNLEKIRELKQQYDPDGLLGSALADRLQLFPGNLKP